MRYHPHLYANQAPQKPEDEEINPPADPTKYGDWSKNGRCIDF